MGLKSSPHVVEPVVAEEANELCPICLDPIVNSSCCACLSCCHVLHVTCMRELKSFGLQACPLCRAPLQSQSASFDSLTIESQNSFFVNSPAIFFLVIFSHVFALQLFLTAYIFLTFGLECVSGIFSYSKRMPGWI